MSRQTAMSHPPVMPRPSVTELDRPLVMLGEETDTGSWQLFRCQPAEKLRPYILGAYHGWTEDTSAPMLRREMPRVMVPVIFNFGTPFTIATAADDGHPAGPEAFHSFAAGLHDRYVVTGSRGLSQCLQVNFTLLGALRLGLDLPALSRRIATAEDAFGWGIKSLLVQLAETGSWSTRFALLEQFILTRFSQGVSPSTDVLAALRHLQRSHGQMRIGRIADDLAIGQKRLIALFQAEIGLPPKGIARLLRFNRALARLRRDPAPELAALATECGYYDQAHFNRDFKLYSGFTPTEMLAHRLRDVDSLAH